MELLMSIMIGIVFTVSIYLFFIKKSITCHLWFFVIVTWSPSASHDHV